MADKQTPQEKAADAALTKKLTLQMLVTDPEYRDLVAADIGTRTALSTKARHESAMVDFKSGNALDRAIAGFEVKATVADYARAKGRKANGEIPEVKLPVGTTPPASDADITAESATA